MITDVCNAKAYDQQLKANSISLILFFDAAHFSKSIDGKVWTILAMILNLPLAIRQSFLYIIPLLFWQGHVCKNFNDILRHHLPELIDIFKNGINFRISFSDIHVDVFLHCIIGDSPARAKISNSIQFNGKYGCLKCMNSGRKKGKKARTYPYKRDVQLRSHIVYRKQAREAEISGAVFEGIKGENFLSNFCSIPDSILIDSMHLLGIVKQMLFMMFDSKNSSEAYYIGMKRIN